MTKAVYPGSFDPITLGHIDIIRRAVPFFEHLTVLVAQSNEKKHLFTDDERKELIVESLAGLSNVSVDIHPGLTVDYLKTHGHHVIIRGIRAVSDFENELVLASMNKNLSPEIETMVMFADPKYNYVASRLIKEVAVHGGDLSSTVPQVVIEALKSKIKN